MRAPRRAAVMRGLLAGGAAGVIVAALMLRGVFTDGLPVVALSLWERGTRLIPLPVFGFFIVKFKFAAKPLGFWTMLASLVAGWAILGALLGGWSRHRGRPAVVIPLAFLLVLLPLAAVTLAPASDYLRVRLEAQSTAVSPAGLIGRVLLELIWNAAAFALVYGLLAARRSPAPRAASPIPGGPPGGGGVSRRRFLGRSFGLAAGALAGSALVQWAAGTGQRAVAFAQTLFDRIKGLPPEVTPTEQFYTVSKNPPGFDPVLKAERWRLEVATQPGKSAVLTYDDIKAMPAVRRAHTLECISNEVGGDLISNAIWRGVRLRDVIDRAGGVDAKAKEIVFRCADGYTESLAISDALHQDTLLVYEMNGAALPPKHGFPVRLLVPGRFGMKNPKWITKIESTSVDFQGYWERSGWSKAAIVKTMSKFTAPTGSHMTAAFGEEVGLGGVAYAGDRGIKAVEVSTDDGKTWAPAQVKAPLGRYTWVLWAALWKPTAPGEYTLKARARDGAGVLQTASEVGTLPDGASGYHRIRVRVRK
jgi:DMSO/TMAO reductase YedYZ molybdopterin-dependent catalytic subunit